MKSRQTSMPRQWLIIDDRVSEEVSTAMRKFARGNGVLILCDIAPHKRQRLLRKLKRLAATKHLTVVDEAAGVAKRVHNLRELRHALLARTPMILLSPLYPTTSHPEWRALPRMRAATFARLAGRRLIALGGMNARRFSRVERLGFQAWAGISAFRT